MAKQSAQKNGSDLERREQQIRYLLACLTLKFAHGTQEQATMGATLLPVRRFVLPPL
jgi:hypothetical protein